MRMYIRTSPRMQALTIGCALFVTLLSIPLFGQNARIHSSGAQANLRIEANVVPAIGPHHHDKDKDRDRGRDENTVAYELLPSDEQLSISHEVRPILIEVQGSGLQNQPVQVTTVVMK